MKNWRRTLVIFFAAGVAGLYFIGSSFDFNLTESCAQIGPCTGCWKNEPMNVSSSDFCFNPSGCVAEPEQQRRNAFVDVVMCACDSARKKDYTDATLNSQIESAVRRMTNGTTVTAAELCDNPGILFTKVAYG